MAVENSKCEILAEVIRTMYDITRFHCLAKRATLAHAKCAVLIMYPYDTTVSAIPTTTSERNYWKSDVDGVRYALKINASLAPSRMQAEVLVAQYLCRVMSHVRANGIAPGFHHGCAKINNIIYAAGALAQCARRITISPDDITTACRLISYDAETPCDVFIADVAVHFAERFAKSATLPISTEAAGRIIILRKHHPELFVA